MAVKTHELIQKLSPCIISCKFDSSYGHYYSVQKEFEDEEGMVDYHLINDGNKSLVGALKKMEEECKNRGLTLKRLKQGQMMVYSL